MATKAGIALVDAPRNGDIAGSVDQYVSVKTLAGRLGVSRRTLISVLAREGAPAPIRISQRCVRWPLAATIDHFRIAAGAEN